MTLVPLFSAVLCGVVYAAPAKQQFISVLDLPSIKIKRNQTVRAVVPIRIKDGFHIQANPATRPNIATRISVAKAEGFLVGTPDYPAGKAYRLQTSDREISTYEGNLEVPIPISAGPSVKTGKLALKGTVRYQACDSKICYLPTEAEFVLPLVVVP